jgi:hypothetical protein
MLRVYRDPLLPVQARLWPPDVLLWGFFQIPRISQIFLGITQTPTSKWYGLS